PIPSAASAALCSATSSSCPLRKPRPSTRKPSSATPRSSAIFPSPRRAPLNPQGQQSYIRMMENYDELGTAPVAAEANLKLLSDALAAGHGATGFFNVFADPDGVVRKGTLALPFGLSAKRSEWDLYASLDVQIVRSYLDLSNDRIILSFGENGIENIEFGSSDVVQPDDVGRVNINYRGPARTFPYTSIADVVSHKFT